MFNEIECVIHTIILFFTQLYYNHRDDTKYGYLAVSNCGDWIMYDRSYQEKEDKQLHKNYLRAYEFWSSRHKNCIKCT